MKEIILSLFITLFTGMIVFLSCKKEESCEGCQTNPPSNGTNKPPIAIAGPDQVITLPTDSILLDGSASSDPDGTISSFLWTKMSGPASFNLSNASVSKTNVKNLVAGVYRFELKVTDDKGLSAKDTMQVIVDAGPNHPPFANAGVDTTITLPANAVNLDGSRSTDPDNNIAGYLWTKISGPSSFNIVNANAVQTQVTNLVRGIYQFELKVTDAGLLISKDTVRASVNAQPPPQLCDNNRLQVNAQLIPIGILSQERIGVVVASAGNKILFAGGRRRNGIFSELCSRVDIYDLIANTWSTAELSDARDFIAAVASGNKVFFAGGRNGDDTNASDVVDIYDALTNIWTVDHLSQAGYGIAAAATGNKVVFAGGEGGFNGDHGNLADIYDLASNTWSTALLSERKLVRHTAVAANNRIYIAGGGDGINSDRIDVYDVATNTWSISTLMEGKGFFLGISTGNMIYWAGGITGNDQQYHASCLVEIKNVNTGISTAQYLFSPGEWVPDFGNNAVIKDNKIVFHRPGGSRFDIYDVVNNSWSIGVLSEPMPGSIISVNNTIYVAGRFENGTFSNQVWRLEF